MSLRAVLTRVVPDTLFARIALVLIVNLALVCAVAVLLVELDDRLGPVAVPYLASQIASNVQTLNSVPQGERDTVADAISGSGYTVWIVEPGGAGLHRVAADADNTLLDSLTSRLRQELTRNGTTPEMWPFDEPGAAARDKLSTRTIRLAVGLSDNKLAAFSIRLTSPSLRWYPALGLAVAICVIVSTMSLVFARSFSRRLAEFASASEALGRSSEGAPLPETGPREIGLATRAFNQMQGRLQRFIRDRTQMLAAMSHDLRTPLTRLRLRAEFIDDPEHRRKMLIDIAEMEAMINETLAFARDDVARERRGREPIDRLIDELARQMRDSGRDVTYDGTESAVVELSPIAMRRALGNLIDNAVKYGGHAHVSLAVDTDHVTVTIDDDGPGIPEELHELVFQPFQRLDDSRNRDTGGVGLGLSVTRTIVRGHGGDIALENRCEGGLRVTVTLPT
ncbi:MAG TPA: ATP-binding protein [Stellaceae bacterium]|nr:ATP-binding protein [Stellaceae bacterium]